MLLLKAQNLVKTFGIRTLFEIDQLEIHDNDRIGLVGYNGTGKSTLLNILYGDEPCDSGVITRKCDVAMVRQSGDAEGESDGRLLHTLSLRNSACKSGGERTRLALAAAFSQNTPLLFADEPTTNLDMEGISILQGMLNDYHGAVVLVSHDRALLDAFCTSIWALEDGKLRIFPGSYTEWVAQKQRERDFAQSEYEHSRAEKARLEVESRNLREQARGLLKTPARMGNSEARLHKRGFTVPQGQLSKRAAALSKRAAMVEESARPADPPEIRMTLGTSNAIQSKTAVRVDGLTVRYGKHAVLQNAAFTLTTGMRTVMLGANGAGKTTAVERLVHGGDGVRLAGNAKIAYFSQNHDVLDPAKTILENVRETSTLAEHEVRTILANLYLAGDAVFKPARVLSGGERAKAVFAKLLASDCNLLILDEPTNHIDLYTAEALETLLQHWQGTMLLITHDRRLAEKLAQRILFVEDGQIRTFEGTWSDWQAEQTRRTAPRDDLATLIDQLRRAAEA